MFVAWQKRRRGGKKRVLLRSMFDVIVVYSTRSSNLSKERRTHSFLFDDQIPPHNSKVVVISEPNKAHM